MSQPIPTRIDQYGPGEMLLGWQTGERYALPYLELRFHCPCAGCVDEHTGQRTLKRESIPADIRPEQVDLVGRYAVHIRWSDGHTTGMYHYDRLFELCEKLGRPISS